MNGYWSKLLVQRVSRRRALAVSGGASLAGALLAACGGGDSGDGGWSRDQSGLLSPSEDTRKQAVGGGIWQTSTNTEPASIEPSTNNASSALLSYIIFFYSQLLKNGLGTTRDAILPQAISGDAAESWEFSPDGTQLTLKIRPNHTFDARPPTNGRAMTSADIKYTWERFSAASAFRGEILNSLSEVGPIDSLTTPDDHTVVIKLAFPYSPILQVLAYHAYIYIAPVEEDRFNSRAETRGSGPFFLEKWEPSVGFEFRRNPNWYRPAFQAARAPYLTSGKAPVNSVVGTTALGRVGALIEIDAVAVLT